MTPEESAAAAPTVVPSSARNVADYLTKLRDVVDRASASRQRWIRQIGQITLAIRRKEALAAATAAVVGREQVEQFRIYRDEAAQLTPPNVCEACHTAVMAWLEKQIAACEVLIEVGETGAFGLMRQAMGLLSEGRIDTMRFRAEYESLIVSLREHVKTRGGHGHKKPKHRVRWPFQARRPTLTHPFA